MSSENLKTTRSTYVKTLAEFNDQRAWYSKRAGNLKKKAQCLDLLVIALGALIAAIPTLKAQGAPTIPDITVSFLGAAVAIAQGAQRIFRYSETWPEYRLASERMKRENRLFLNTAPPYDLEDTEAKRIFVLRLEEIIADEQKIFFDQALGKKAEGESDCR
jgi:hypothetical protein